LQESPLSCTLTVIGRAGRTEAFTTRIARDRDPVLGSGRERLVDVGVGNPALPQLEPDAQRPMPATRVLAHELLRESRLREQALFDERGNDRPTFTPG